MGIQIKKPDQSHSKMKKSFNQLTDNLAKLSLVGVFFFFPIGPAPTNFLMALTLFFWSITGDHKKRWQSIQSHPLTRPAIGMFFLVVFGLLYTKAPLSDGLHNVQKYSKFLFIPIILILSDENQWRNRCFYAFFMAMIFTIASSYAGIWWSVPWSTTKDQVGWEKDHTVFKDYIAQGLLISTFILISISKIFKETALSRQFFWTAMAFLGIINILFLSNGRSGYSALLLGLAGFFWVIYKRTAHKLITILGLGLLAPLAYFSSPLIQARVDLGYTEVKQALARPINQSAENLTSLGARIDMWRVSINGIKEKPIFGHGTGSYPTIAKEAFHSQDVLNVQGVHPHNQFLFFGVELGLTGMLAYVFYLYRAGSAGRNMNTPDKAALIGFLGIMLSDSLFNSALWLSTENHLFTFMLALLASMKPTKQKPTPQG